MKQFSKTLALVCALALCLAAPVLADYTADDLARELRAPHAANVPISGTVAVQEDGRLLVTSPNPDAPNSPIVLSYAEARVLDAVTLQPVDPLTIADGDYIYAWINPFMALSYPAQGGAQLILVNIPQDYVLPGYHQIVTADLDADSGVLTVLTDKNETLTLTRETVINPYMTLNLLYLDSLVPGTHMLVWAQEGAVREVLAFAYGYNGWMQVDPQTGAVSIRGEAVDLSGSQTLMMDSDLYQGVLLPFRALCEGQGRTVSWDADTRTATAAGGHTQVIEVTLGSTAANLGGAEAYLTLAPVLHQGRTMVAARDMATLLGLYYSELG